MGKRISVVAYGAIAYLGFLAVFTYTIGFLAERGRAQGRRRRHGRAGLAWRSLIDAALLGALRGAAQRHGPALVQAVVDRASVSPAVERSTYVLAAEPGDRACCSWQWRPLPGHGVVGRPSGGPRALLWALYLARLGRTGPGQHRSQLGHFDLFGLRQVLARARDRRYAEPGSGEPLLYRLVRHPLMVGFLIAFWATPAHERRPAALRSGRDRLHPGGGPVRGARSAAATGRAVRAVREQVPRFVPRPRARVGERTH